MKLKVLLSAIKQGGSIVAILIEIALVMAYCPVSFAEGYNPIVQQVQTNLTAQGFYSGELDGIYNTVTAKAIAAFQRQVHLPVTAKLDTPTLEKLAINKLPDDKVAVKEWEALPTQQQIDNLVAESAYADYVPYAPGVNLNIPGQSILEAMNQSADRFGSRRADQPGHTLRGYGAMLKCLNNGHVSAHWSDLTVHYFCQMSLPRTCYTQALSGKSTHGVKLLRTNAYASCASGQLQRSADFSWVVKNQPLVFQFIMFGQTHAFNHEQEQAVINAFYGVQHPSDREECRLKRPRRFHDPVDGSHCLVNKVMLKQLVGIGI